MKINYILAVFFLFFSGFQLQAQDEEKNINSRITSATYLENLMKDASSTSYVVTSEYTSAKSGIKHTYVRQAINGIEVHGTESSIHTDANGSTVMAHVNFVDAIESSLKNASAGMTAEQAIASVAQQMGYDLSNLQRLESATGSNQKAVFNGAGISNRDIPVKLMYHFKEGQGTTMVWELSVMEKDSPDWWNFRVDATSGIIIDKDNWTVNCGMPGDHGDEGHKAMAHNREHKATTTKTHVPLYTATAENSALASSYNVFPLPLESPYSGTRFLEVDPDDAAASPLGWHDDGTSSYTYTKGNNVSAYDDGGGDDTGSVADHTPESSTGLVFDYAFDSTAPGGDPNYFAAMQSEDAAITNLFYWNNIIHDITYHYGFDEEAGNFQETNSSGMGLGSDSVNAEAQDEADLAPTAFNRCNANFGTPPDGGNPRMQMYICDGAPTAGHNDGDFDNLVIVHEYAHGISNRLTGGPAVANGLNNAEQMGEGWSDFYGYMLTMDAGNATSDRVVGTFLFDQGPTGPGIRNAPYSTSLTTNPFTYGDVSDTGTVSSPHGIGFIWASMLYEMTQALITTYGFDPDLYTGTGGNNMAMQLVTDGLKLQPVFPGFVDGRDAILAADLAMNGGANECLIWTAFAKRGLGFSADQGSSSSRTDGTEAFDLPPATLTPSRTSICVSEGVVTGLSGGRLIGGVYSGANVTDGGDGMTFSFDAGTAGIGMHTVTYTDPCQTPSTVAMATITVTDGVPALVCQPATLTLDGAGDATLVEADVVANLPAADGSNGYTVDETGTFAPETITGTTVTLGDDSGTAAIPIGFGFDFFGTNYTDFYIASNGFVSFTGNGMTTSASWTPTALPSAGVPNGMVAVVWDDLSPNISGTIRYELIGTMPNRKLVVNYESVPLFSAPETVTAQLQLHEGTNVIEIHTTLAENNGGVRTQGIENAAGDDAYTTSGRNLAVWTATSDYVAFVPVGGSLPENCGNPVSVSFSQTDFTCADIGDNTVTVTVDDGMGGIATCDATVTIVGPTSTYTGTWDVTPDAGRKALFNTSYNTSTADITACSCEVASSSTVTVDAGGFLNITGNIKVGAGSTLLVEHEGSVVQINDAASVTNDGSITIEKITPTLAAGDFMVVGSPMSAETQAGVYGAGYNMRNHVTGNFVPHPDVASMFPLAENFSDDNGNNWLTYTGAINPGEGYLVFPQPDVSSSGSYTHNYTQGTLNNGVVAFDVLFNTTQNDSPNVLSNPYASAIDADLFFAETANAAIDVLYFWEHLTAASPTYPGYFGANYDMGDISLYSESMGGLAAANGGATPNDIIASGQGFGIKAASAITATFNNAMRITGPNDTYRNTTVTERDRVWINVFNDTYELGSTTLIGFSENTSDEFNNSEDIKRLATPVSLYSELDTGEQLAINALGSFEADEAITLSFVTQVKELQEYRISIQDIDGLNIENETVYLIDNELGSITSLSEGDYTFQSDEGIQSKRFTIVFENSLLGINDAILETIAIYPNPTQNMLSIASPRTAVTAATVYDISGRIVIEQRFSNQGNYQLDLSELNVAMYFVEIVTENGSITKQIIKR